MVKASFDNFWVVITSIHHSRVQKWLLKEKEHSQLPHNRSRTFKLPCLKLNGCCLGNYFALFWNLFNSKWLINNLNGLSLSTRVLWYEEIKHKELDFRYFEIWLFLAIFGYFWDWKWLHDNTGNFWWLEICWKHVS